MLAFSFIWSTIFLACVLAASWSRNRTPIVLGLGAAGFFVPPLCMFVSMATSLHIVFVCAAACVCAVTKAQSARLSTRRGRGHDGCLWRNCHVCCGGSAPRASAGTDERV